MDSKHLRSLSLIVIPFVTRYGYQKYNVSGQLKSLCLFEKGKSTEKESPYILDRNFYPHYKINLEHANRQRKPKSKGDLLSPMMPEIRKAFYRWLGDRKSLADFVKRTGVDGRVIEEELQVYRRLQDADPFELQEKILRTIGYEEGEINSITAVATRSSFN